MDVPPAGIVNADKTFPYVNTAALYPLASTYSDFFSGSIAPAHCGTV